MPLITKNSVLLLILLSSLFFTQFAYAITTKATNAIVVDGETNQVLFEHRADDKTYPSSMSKMMTIYIAFKYLKTGIISWDEKYKISPEAWRVGGSSMFLKQGEYVAVNNLLKGVITVSGNDAAVALAEGAMGSQENFVREMNRTADLIGLTNSHFTNVTGLTNPEHYMSARDLAKISMRLYQEFPEFYPLFAEKEFIYNNIKQKNNNALLWQDYGVDGIKTGHTEAGGYGVAVSAAHNGRRIFLVVNGLKSDQERTIEARNLLNYGLRWFDTKTIFIKGEKVEDAEVIYGKKALVGMALHEDFTLTFPRENLKNIKVIIKYQKRPAPIKRGTEIGKLIVSCPGLDDKVLPLYSMEDIPSINFVARVSKQLLGIK